MKGVTLSQTETKDILDCLGSLIPDLSGVILDRFTENTFKRKEFIGVAVLKKIQSDLIYNEFGGDNGVLIVSLPFLIRFLLISRECGTCSKIMRDLGGSQIHLD